MTVPIQYSDMFSSAPITTRDHTARFQDYWLAETIRLRESQWGPLQDSSEARRARALKGSFAQRLLQRAGDLGQREGLDTVIRQWTSGARLAFSVLLILALLTGAATAAGALGDGTRQVNLAMAFTALLGLHLLTFIFWCIGSALPLNDTKASLGDAWLWLTRKLARGPLVALVPRALTSMLARQNALRPLLGSISHALWLCALTAMLITLVALLSTRRYTFSWETTLLSPDTFVWLTAALGWLPEKLGFSIPPDAIIRASDGLQALPDAAHALWSSWLMGCLICYGLLPRLCALAATASLTIRRSRALTLDTRLPGYIELRERLEPRSVAGDIDAPAPPAVSEKPLKRHIFPTGATRVMVGLELAHDQPWPPITLDTSITDLGIVDDRQQRQHLLETLQSGPPHKLLLVCDAHQTPDRGTLALIRELTGLAEHTHVMLQTRDTPASSNRSSGRHPVSSASHPATDTLDRQTTWRSQLQKMGLPVNNLHTDFTTAVTWLSSATAPDSPSDKTAS